MTPENVHDARQATTRAGVAADAAFIGLIVVLSSALYAGSLGFHADDWALLGFLAFPPDPNLRVMLGHALDDVSGTRPVAWLYILLRHALFGTEPLGYHLLNSGLMAAAAMLYYVALRGLGQARALALAIVLVYALLPHYSTNRFWPASGQATLSAAAFFLCLWAQTHAVGSRAMAWRALALCGLIISALSYELFLPLLIAVPAVAWWFRRDPEGGLQGVRGALVACGFNLAIIVLLALGKASASDRVVEATLADHVAWFVRFLGGVTLTTVAGEFGLSLPGTLAMLLREQPRPEILVVGLLTGILVYAWLQRAASAAAVAPVPRAAVAGSLIVAGTLAFVAGYAVFLASMNAEPPLGIGFGNRVTMAAAAGVALGVTGVFGLLTMYLPSAWRTRAFCALVAATCAGNVVAINALARYWIEAADRQSEVIRQMRADVPSLPPGSILLLDGVCPYLGPTAVFESYWDMSGMLRVTYGDPTLSGDVVTRKMRVADDGMYTEFYVPVGPHPYAQLRIYDVSTRQLVPITGPDAAREYFAMRGEGSNLGCPLRHPGRGEARLVSELLAP